MIRVIVADGHPFVRSGIRSILQNTPDIEVVGEAVDARKARELAQELQPDLLVLDMEMPGLKGSNSSNKLPEYGKDLPVLVLGTYADRQFILGMLARGADGYLTKDEVPDMIARAIREVAGGQRGWVSREAAARIAVWSQKEEPGEFNFTRQDIEILKMVLAGKTSKGIAMKFDLSENEVERKLQKLVAGIRDRLDRTYGPKGNPH